MGKTIEKTIFSAILILLFASSLSAADNVVHYVKQGLDFYKAEDYESALYAFETAETFAADDLRILYNQGCALLKSGRKKEAAQKFRKTAFAKDRNIAYESLMHLGNLAVEQAREISDRYAKSPSVSASAKKRILDELKIAEKEFSDAMFLLKNSQDAPKSDPKKIKAAKDNLEMVRVWKKQITDSWRKQERALDRPVIDYLIEVEKKQEKLRRDVLAASATEESSKKFQFLYLCSKEQTHLREDLINMQEKLQEKFLESPEELQELLPIEEEHWEEQIEKLRQMTEEYASYSNNASKHLSHYDGESALQFQAAALEMIDSIRNEFRSYEQVVRAAEELHSKLCSEVEPRSDEEGYEEIPALRRELSRKTRFVLRWTILFTEKAKPEVEAFGVLQLDSFLAEIVRQSFPLNMPGTSNADAFTEIHESDDELLFKSKQLAVQYGPKIEAALKTILRNLERNVEMELNPTQQKKIFTSMTQVKMALKEILEPLNEKIHKEMDDLPEEQPNEIDDPWGDQLPWNVQQNEENSKPDTAENNAQDEPQKKYDGSGNTSEGDDSTKSSDSPGQSPSSSAQENDTGEQQGKENRNSDSQKNPGEKQGTSENRKDDRTGGSARNPSSSEQRDWSNLDGSEDFKDFQSRETLEVKELDSAAVLNSLSERDLAALEQMSGSEREKFFRQRKQGQDRAENLIRSVKRRQREADKVRGQIRDLLRTSGDRDVKDW